jgi:hypothetical protein
MLLPIHVLITEAPNHPVLEGDEQRSEKKPAGNKIRKFQMQQIRIASHRLLAEGASLGQYASAGIPIFHSSVNFFFCLSLFFQLSLSPLLHLLHYTENKNNSKRG